MALNFPFKKPLTDSQSLKGKPESDYEFYKAINLFISQREELGISLDVLSKKTKISRNVLIAIENGWEKHIPETTYLISMIKSLEINLNLDRGSLKGLLAKKNSIDTMSNFKFNFINIDFLNSWIGSLFYIFLMLISILVLNIQQRYLIKTNSVSNEPITTEKTFMNNGDILNNKKGK